jgi:uncharacterized protein with HEPN domain
MSSNRPRQRLRDILENLAAIVAFTAGMTLAEYLCMTSHCFARPSWRSYLG